jgi:hypothetical protein
MTQTIKVTANTVTKSTSNFLMFISQPPSGYLPSESFNLSIFLILLLIVIIRGVLKLVNALDAER